MSNNCTIDTSISFKKERIDNKLDDWCFKLIIGANICIDWTFLFINKSSDKRANIIIVPSEWPIYEILFTLEIYLI